MAFLITGHAARMDMLNDGSVWVVSVCTEASTIMLKCWLAKRQKSPSVRFKRRAEKSGQSLSSQRKSCPVHERLLC